MKLPALFTLINKSAVRAIFGDAASIRFYPIGEVPEKPMTPYATWSVSNGTPENYLNQTPDVDSFSIVIDIFVAPEKGTIALFNAMNVLRDALETSCYISAWSGNSVDEKTKLLHTAFVTDWINER